MRVLRVGEGREMKVTTEMGAGVRWVAKWRCAASEHHTKAERGWVALGAEARLWS